MTEMSEAAREARRAYNREYQQKNRERLREYNRRWRAEHREKINAKQRAKYDPQKHKEYEARRWEKKAAQIREAQQQLESVTL